MRTRHRSDTTPHHVTQRGNARQFILATDAERLVYLDLLRLSEVERRCSLRNGAARRIAGRATLGGILDSRGLAELSRGGNSPAEADAVRESTHTGRPLGTLEFIQRPETRLRPAPLVAPRGGRPRKAFSDSRQSTLNF
jgi:hypothetical protein